MMKKKIKKLILALAALLLVIGITFAVLRPSYVQEAWNILFSNELTVENIMEDNEMQ